MQALNITAMNLPGRAAVPAPARKARITAVLPSGRGSVQAHVAAPGEAGGALSGEWATGTSFASIEDVEEFFKSHQAHAAAPEKPDEDVDADGVLSGEWPASWSLASYDDVKDFIHNHPPQESK